MRGVLLARSKERRRSPCPCTGRSWSALCRVVRRACEKPGRAMPMHESVARRTVRGGLAHRHARLSDGSGERRSVVDKDAACTRSHAHAGRSAHVGAREQILSNGVCVVGVTARGIQPRTLRRRGKKGTHTAGPTRPRRPPATRLAVKSACPRRVGVHAHESRAHASCTSSWHTHALCACARAHTSLT